MQVIEYRVSPEEICHVCELIQLSTMDPRKLIQVKEILADRRVPRKIVVTKENLEEAEKTIAKMVEENKQGPPKWLENVPDVTERWQHTVGKIQAASKKAIGEMYQLSYQ